MMARAEAQQPHSGNAGFRVLPLLTAVALIALLTVYPHIATDNAGAADHLTAMLLLWSMSAGLVCGGLCAAACSSAADPVRPACFIAGAGRAANRIIDAIRPAGDLAAPVGRF
jgi:hypothetical protein